jgi:hypothetical protein
MADYIPGSDADCLQFLTNAGSYINANAAALGVPTARATLLMTQITAFGSALGTHTTAQAAAQGARASKDASKQAVVVTAREIIATIQTNTAVTPAQKEAMGIPVHDSSRSPVPPPTVLPGVVLEETRRLEQTVRIVDSGDPTRRAKPAGVTAWQVFVKVGETQPLSTSDCALASTSGKSKVTLSFAGGDAGKTAWLMVRAVNHKGEAGPASDPVEILVAA